MELDVAEVLLVLPAPYGEVLDVGSAQVVGKGHVQVGVGELYQW